MPTTLSALAPHIPHLLSVALARRGHFVYAARIERAAARLIERNRSTIEAAIGPDRPMTNPVIYDPPPLNASTGELEEAARTLRTLPQNPAVADDLDAIEEELARRVAASRAGHSVAWPALPSTFQSTTSRF